MARLPAEAFWFTFARNEADSLEMNVDGTTPVNFDVSPDGDCEIARIMFQLQNSNIHPDTFAGLSALSNGVKVQCVEADGTLVTDFLDGLTLKSDIDFGLLAGVDTPILAGVGNGDDILHVRWTLRRATAGKSLELTGGRILRFTVQDNLAALTQFRIFAQGKT